MRFVSIVWNGNRTNLEPSQVSDPASRVGEVEPDFDAAEVRAFGADRCGDASAQMARWADVARELGMDFAELRNLVHRSLKNFLLRIEARAHSPFVKQMKKRAGLVETDGFGVRENVERDFKRHATVE